MNYTATDMIQVALEILGALVVIAGGIKAISYFISPFRTVKKQVDEHETKIVKANKHLSQDKEAIEELRELVKDSIKLSLALVNHEIDGNDIEHMKQLRKEIQEKL